MCRYILLVEQFALGDNGESQFNGSAIQKHNLHPVCLENMCQFMGEAGLNPLHIDDRIDEHGQVIVAHRTDGALSS